MPAAPELERVPFTGLLVTFAGELRAAGLAVGSGDVLMYCSALSRLNPADLVDLHRSLLSGLGLPVAGRFDLQGLRQAWLRDKKYRDGTRFVLLNGLGRPEAGIQADDDNLAAVMADLSS